MNLVKANKMSKINGLLILFFLAFLPTTIGLQMSMYRRDTYRQQLMREERWTEHHQLNQAVISHFQQIQLTPITRFQSTSQPLYDYSDQEYNIRLSIGSPPQMFEVLPETSTANFWVADRACNGSYDECPVFCQVNQGYCQTHCIPKCCNSTTSSSDSTPNPCTLKRKFDQDTSSSYEKDGRYFQLPFGLGNVSGILGVDTVTLGDPNNNKAIKIPKTTFGQAQTLAVEFGKLPLDGMLGLAFRKASVDDVQPVFQHALDLKLFDEPIFTLWLAAYGIGSIDEPAGGLSFGSRDPENCQSDAKFIPLISESIWAIQVDAVGTSGQPKNSQKQTAILSLGSSMLLMAIGDLMDLVRGSKADYNFDYGLFEVACDAQFSWSVYVGGNELKVENKQLIWKLDNGICILAAGTWGDAPHPVDLVLGVPYLRQFCTLFDVQNEKVGFATKLNKK